MRHDVNEDGNKRLLAVSLGNSAVSFGLFQGDRLAGSGKVALGELDRLAESLPEGAADAAVLASVAPSRNQTVCEIVRSRFAISPLLLGRDLAVPIPVLCRDPEQVGVDRLVNGLAAYARVQDAVIIVDAGTAITVDVVSEPGEFLGGAIAPGLRTGARALELAAEQLPCVSVARPERAIGRDTEAAIRAGLYWGAVGMVERILKEQVAESGGAPVIIATGGDGGILADEIAEIEFFLPDLALEGIRLAWESTGETGKKRWERREW